MSTTTTTTDPLVDTLMQTFPTGTPADQCLAMACAALAAFQPADIIQAMLAVRIIAAHHASMDGYRRAMLPDVTDAESIRLRNNAIAAGRSFNAELRTLRALQAPDAAPIAEPAAKPARRTKSPASALAEPAPPANDMQPLPDGPPPESAPEFTPRNRHGEPIRAWRWQDMTMAQRRATYGSPDDAETIAIAVAEETAMIEAERQRAAAPDDNASSQLSSSLSQ